MAFWNRSKPLEKEPSQPGLTRVRHKVAIASGKGGVGKSTVTANLALALRMLGARVGVLDADIYGPSQPGILGAKDVPPEIKDGLLYPTVCHGVGFVSMGSLMGKDGPVVWRAPMAMKVIHQFLGNVVWGDLDYLLIDLPPGTGDVQITLSQQATLSGAIIVSTPQEVALGIAKKGLQMFDQVKVPILGIVENMSGFVCGHCGEQIDLFKKGGAKNLSEELKVPFLGAIPLDPKIMEASDSGVPLIIEDPHQPASESYLKLARQFETNLRTLDANLEEPQKIEEEKDGTLMIRWKDGKSLYYDPYRLRLACPCALCVDENTGKPLLAPSKVPLGIQIKSVSQIGRYAISIQFSDGHDTGIYTYESLRKLGKPKQKVEELSF